jgi:hypothetical protein
LKYQLVGEAPGSFLSEASALLGTIVQLSRRSARKDRHIVNRTIEKPRQKQNRIAATAAAHQK